MIAPHPKQHLLDLTRRHPGLWRAVNDIIARRPTQWPDWCYLPVPAWSAALSGGRPAPMVPASVLEAGIAAAIGAWRMTQSIYRFDPDLYAALISTPLERDIPIEVLCRLPEWCVYIETPGLGYTAEDAPLDVAGAWLHLDWGHKTGLIKLRALLNTSGGLIPIGCPLIGTLAASLDAALAEAAQHSAAALPPGLPQPDMPQAAQAIGMVLAQLTSLLLYLCADGAEIGDGATRPANPAPRRTRHGPRLFQADNVSVWDVGLRLGAALRQARHSSDTAAPDDTQPGAAARPRAHIRRAHWHTFLAGPARAERRIKWLPPIPINIGDPESMPVTIRQAGAKQKKPRPAPA